MEEGGERNQLAHHLDTVFRTFNLSDEHSKDSFTHGVWEWTNFTHQILKAGPPDEAIELFPTIIEEAWLKTRIRCLLIEHFVKLAKVQESFEVNKSWVDKISRIIMLIRRAMLPFNSRDEGVACVREIEKEQKGGTDNLVFVWSMAPFKPHVSDFYGWTDYPVKSGFPTVMYCAEDHVDVKTTAEPNDDGTAQLGFVFQENREEGFRASLLSGQQAAFDQLRLMLDARREGLTAGGIKPRLHGLVIGPSGSGKTHVVRAVAECEHLPLFEQSAGSWMPQGSKAEISSPRRIAEFVKANEKGIIYLDEVEKPFPPDLAKTVPWERYCTDEFMSLLDAKVAHWEHWSERLAKKLDKHFFIILSGAWQAAYTMAYKAHALLGGNWGNLSIADSFLDSNHLPPELLNRISTNVIEVLPPNRDELAEMILRVQRDLGICVNAAEAKTVAKEITENRKGVRAVEEYLLKKWMQKRSKPQDTEITNFPPWAV